MAMLLMPEPLSRLADGRREHMIAEGPVVQSFAKLCEQHPELSDALFTGDNRLSPFISVALNGSVQPRGSIDKLRIEAGDVVKLIVSLSGG